MAQGFVEPEDRSVALQAAEVFKCACTPDFAELVEVSGVDQSELSSPDEKLGTAFQAFDSNRQRSRDAALWHFLIRYRNDHQAGQIKRPLAIAQRLAQSGWDLTAGLLADPQGIHQADFHGNTWKQFAVRGLLDRERLVDPVSLELPPGIWPNHDGWWFRDYSWSHFEDVSPKAELAISPDRAWNGLPFRDIGEWVAIDGLAAVEPFVGRSLASGPTLNTVALCSIDAMLRAWSMYRHEGNQESLSEIAAIAHPITEALDACEAWKHTDPVFVALWLSFTRWEALRSHMKGEHSTLGDLRGRVAVNALGLLRPAARELGDDQSKHAMSDFGRRWRLAEHRAVPAAMLDAGLWRATKALLLLFRAVGTPALERDLSFRKGGEDAVSRVPELLLTRFAAHSGEALEQDPGLGEFRESFGALCLERLGSRKRVAEPRNNDLREPDPKWRWAWIRALRELHVNPGGKGHRTLHWSIQNDPDEDVCAAAKVAYDRLRRSPTLPNGLSPRRAVMHALWWLCQAHLLALHVELDPDGAQRTRERLARLTAQFGDPD